jgi:hypothetical protein
MRRSAKPRKPRRLRKGDQANFDTLLRAARAGDLALVSAIRKRDQKNVALVCAVERLADGDCNLTPLAITVEGNPFADFEAPTT